MPFRPDDPFLHVRFLLPKQGSAQRSSSLRRIRDSSTAFFFCRRRRRANFDDFIFTTHRTQLLVDTVFFRVTTINPVSILAQSSSSARGACVCWCAVFVDSFNLCKSSHAAGACFKYDGALRENVQQTTTVVGQIK